MNYNLHTYRKLGDFITQRREKNNGYDVPIRGVSKEGFIDPKQKDADTSIYNVFYKNDFVFNPARMELNSIALNRDLEKGICSSLYEIFYINETDVLDPIYLNMLLKRDHFIRFCAFKGWGSVREYFRVNEICEYMIPVPPIEEQRRIVSEYQTVERRIQNNELLIKKLEETAQAIYHHTFVEGVDEENLPEGWKKGTIKDIVTTQYGYTASAIDDKRLPYILRITDIVNDYISWETVPNCEMSKQDINSYVLSEGDIVVARTGANIGYAKQIIGNIPLSVFASFLVRLKAINPIYKWYLGIIIESQIYKDYIFANQQGSAQPQANPNVMTSFPLVIPNQKDVEKFNEKVYNILLYKSNLAKEITQLRSLLSLLTSKLS